jgi:pimeloyl-ACP methyl ester carboxylesterase
VVDVPDRDHQVSVTQQFEATGQRQSGPGADQGSGWRGVYDLLTQDGYHVAVVQNPTLTLQGDAAAARLIIDAQDGLVVLVGHSYGGAVISEAGTDPKVAALVYVSAFAPDAGESVNTLLSGFPQDGPQPPISRPRTGSCSWTRTSSTPRSLVTCRPTWPTRRSPGAWTRSAGKSASRRGGPSRAGI